MLTISDGTLCLHVLGGTLQCGGGGVYGVLRVRHVTLGRHSEVSDPLESFLHQSDLIGKQHN